MPTFLQVLILGVIQGVTELLPISSSAHVITAERWMGLDPTSPEMTFLLVMLHTGTMGAVLLYFWSRWKKLDVHFLKMTVMATGVTAILGLVLKVFIEKVILEHFMGETHAEIEHLFKSTPLMACALFTVGIFMIFAGVRDVRSQKTTPLEPKTAVLIGLVQGLCLPFRGFSRSGATISTGLLRGVQRHLAEDFSFALAVLLTPPVIFLELRRLFKAHAEGQLMIVSLNSSLLLGALGMLCSFGAGLLALRWLSSWLEAKRWQYFGFYCVTAAVGLFFLG